MKPSWLQHECAEKIIAKRRQESAGTANAWLVKSSLLEGKHFLAGGTTF